MAIELYSWPMSSGTRICWALEELGVPYQYIELDQAKQEHLAPAYLAINPHGKVPALVDGDVRLFESAAILLHLGDKYGVDKGLWPAAGTPARADAMSWVIWSSADLTGYMFEFMYHGMDSPVSYKPADRSAGAAAYNRSQLDRMLATLEGRLKAHEYLQGSHFTLVDLAVAGILGTGAMLGLSLADHPRTAAWCKRCTERAAFKRAR